MKNVLHRYCGKIGILPFGKTPNGLDEEAPIYVQTVRKVPLSWTVIYSNIWAKHQVNREKHHFWSFPKIFANWSKMLSINYSQMCFSIPRCLCMLTDAIIGVDQRTHTHSLSLSLSLCLFALFPHLFVSDKNPLPRLFDYHWKYRFHRVRLLSFHR
jgi:hypothetical protein